MGQLALAILAAVSLGACHDAPTAVHETPAIDSLTPDRVLLEGGAQTLTIIGRGFHPSSRARWNGADRPTTYVDRAHLTIALRDDDAATRGSGALTVYNGPPGGGASPARMVPVDFPLPVLGDMTPASALAGTSSVLVRLRGTGFVTASGISVSPPIAQSAQPQYVSPTELQLLLFGQTLATPGVLHIAVVNPGSAPTSTRDFAIDYPVPTLSALFPDSILPSLGPLVVATGTHLYPGSTIDVNGQPRTTTFGDSTQLIAALTASDLTTPGDLRVTIVNPAPGGGASAPLTLVVRPSTLRIVRAVPSVVPAGSGPITLTATGSGFLATSTLRWNGTPLATTFAAPDTLRATVPAALLTGAATAMLTATDPAISAPSEAYAVSVTPTAATVTERVLNYPNFDIAYDPTRDLIYAAGNGQSVTEVRRLFAVNPNTGAIAWDMALAHSPNQLAVSSDGAFLYATLNDAFSLLQFDLALRVAREFQLKDRVGDRFQAVRIAAVPDMPDAVVVATADGRTILMQGGVFKAEAPGLLLAPGAATGEVLAATADGSLRRYRVLDGRLLDDQRRGTLATTGAGTSSIAAGGGVVFGAGGGGADARTLLALGAVPAVGLQAVDGPNLRVHFFANLAIRSFHARSLEPVLTIPVANATGAERKVIRWGHNGLALQRVTGIVLLSGPGIAP